MQQKRDLTPQELQTIQQHKKTERQYFAGGCLSDLEPADWHFFTRPINSLRKCIVWTFIFHAVIVVLSFVLVIIRRSITVIIFNVVLLIMDAFGLWIFTRHIHSFFLCYVITFWIVLILEIGGMILAAVISLEPGQIFLIHVPLLIDVAFTIFITIADCKFKPYKRAVAALNAQIDKDKAKQAVNNPFRQQQQQQPQPNNQQQQPLLPPARPQFRGRVVAQPLGARAGENERVYHKEALLMQDELKAQEEQRKEYEKDLARGGGQIELQERGVADDALQCVVCLSRAKGICFLPCQHVCCCEQCAAGQERCPMCRGQIEQAIKVFI